MVQIHTPMHKQAQIMRGLMKRIEDLEEAREPGGRVDFSRVVTEVATAAAVTQAEHTLFDDPSFVWDHDHPDSGDTTAEPLGFDMVILDEDAPRAVSSTTPIGPGDDGDNGNGDDGEEEAGGFGTSFGTSFGN